MRYDVVAICFSMNFSFSRNHWIVAIIGASFLAGVVGGIVGIFAAPALREPISRAVGFSMNVIRPSSNGLTPPPLVLPLPGIAEDEQSVAVVERDQPAIVSILILKDASKLPQPFMMDPFFGSPVQPQTPPLKGLQHIGGGSGFFVSQDGMIVTNRHVVEDPEAEYSVMTRDGKEHPAKVLARDSVFDLAILKIDGTGYPFLTLADSNTIKVGQTVLAVGNALDEFRNTVTKGIVSGLNRRITAGGGDSSETIEGAIQTDAAINPGNSGGPLIDLEGRVVGVNTAVSSDAQLIGFALPSNVVHRDVEQVKASGRIARPFLGVRYLVIDPALVEKNQLPVTHGVLVSRGATAADLAVTPGSPADKAGIKENDILLAMNGTEINEEHSLSSMIGMLLPGDLATLQVYRQGKTFDVSVTLAEFKTATSPTP